MKRSFSICAFIFIPFLCNVLTAGNGDKKKSEVIRINDKAVSVDEFTDRLNFVTNGNEFITPLEKKENLAASIIAEKIFAEEARRMKFDTIRNVKVTTAQYEKEAVYECWMQKEISDKIHISENELLATYPKFRQQRVVDFVRFNNKDSAEKQLELINEKGSSNFPIEDSVQTKTLSFGESLQLVEDCIYSLKENEFSPILFIDNEYYIFKLNKIIPHPDNSKEDYVYWKESIEKIIRQRKSFQNFEKVMPELMRSRGFTINKQNYEFVVDQLSKQLKFGKTDSPGFPEAANLELAVIPQNLESYLNQAFIKFDDNEIWTINDVWQKLRFGPYLLNYNSDTHFKKDFPNLLRRMVLIETVITDGYKKSYNHSEYVVQQAAMWSDDLLSKLYQYEINKNIKISEAEIYEYYSANKSRFKLPEMCRILGIFVNDSSLAVNLKKRILAGEDIITLVKKYSKRTFDGRNIEDGIYIAKDTWGDLGTAAFLLKPGEISGPINIGNNQFAVIKLMERIGEKTKEIDMVKNEIQTELLRQKSYSALSDSLNKLCDTYDISIDKTALKKIQLIEGNMFLRKSHFPNRMVVPLTTGFSHDEPWFHKFIK